MLARNNWELTSQYLREFLAQLWDYSPDDPQKGKKWIAKLFNQDANDLAVPTVRQMERLYL